MTALASSFMLSADNAHAVHPNHPELYDAQNRVYMNGGVVIKHNARQKYTTDGVSSALFTEVCRRAGVPVQHFANRSDILGGGTLGNISNSPRIHEHGGYRPGPAGHALLLRDGRHRRTSSTWPTP